MTQWQLTHLAICIFIPLFFILVISIAINERKEKKEDRKINPFVEFLRAKYNRELFVYQYLLLLIAILIIIIVMSLNMQADKAQGAGVAYSISIILPSPTPLISLGDFRCTAYSLDVKDCGKATSDKEYGITYSGKRVIENYTVAVDPRIIPLGTKLMIDGHIYEAMDTGRLVKGQTIDIYMPGRKNALKFGVQNKTVYLLK